MNNIERLPARGYLTNNFRISHLKDCKDSKFSYHYHVFYKIIYFISGDITYTIDGKAYRPSPGDLLFIEAGQIHKLEVCASEMYERYVIWISPEYLKNNNTADSLIFCFEYVRKKNNYLFRPEKDSILKLQQLLKSILKEDEKKEFGYALLQDALFKQFLIMLNRSMLSCSHRPQRQLTAADHKIEAILVYIDSHLREHISIEQLSKDFYISQSYLMNRFRTLTGLPVYRYIQEKRLSLAADLIRQGMPVLEAASSCGYKDYSAFLKGFHRYYGCCPREISSQPSLNEEILI